MISNPKASVENDAVKDWMFGLLDIGDIIVLPEITDYEVRRELIRADKSKGIESLDLLKTTLEYLPIDTQTMLDASRLWAQARKIGKPATDNLALDGDMVLVAQSRAASRLWADESTNGHTIIATTNVKHLANFCDARLWHDIL